MSAKVTSELTVSEYQKRWRESHKEQFKEHQKRWRDNNPGKRAEYAINSAVRKLQSLGYVVEVKITKPQMEVTTNV